ncbi:MAG: hypothetical protein HRU19_30330 [Pseudobacteriovorax sp.]|nr:hypothetical protein [Pseudobacteriovorax sp.]
MTDFNQRQGSFFSIWVATTDFGVDFGFDHGCNRVFEDFRFVEHKDQLCPDTRSIQRTAIFHDHSRQSSEAVGIHTPS